MSMWSEIEGKGECRKREKERHSVAQPEYNQ